MMRQLYMHYTVSNLDIQMMFQVLEKNNFAYDCSWPTRQFQDPGLWPYTLDYASTQVQIHHQLRISVSTTFIDYELSYSIHSSYSSGIIFRCSRY